MRILKPVGEKLELDGKLYHLLFNLNVIDEIQEYYDMPIVDVLNAMFDIKDKQKKRESYNMLAYVLTVLINEDIRIKNKKNPESEQEKITIEYLREEIITNETSSGLALLVLKAFNGTLTKDEDEDEDPNLKGVQVKK